MTGRGRLDIDDAGNAAVGMVIVVPVIMIVALAVVGLGRTVSVQQSVTGAARSAARAASLAPDDAQAAVIALGAATAALGDRCRTVTIAPDVSAFTAGGAVKVDITCVVPLEDLAISGLPGHATLSASATAPVETWRRVGP